MSPITHLLASWVVAVQTTDNPRDCRLVTLAGIVPDADGLGLGADLVTRAFSTNPTAWYEQYHHFLFHGAFGAVLTSAALAIFANQKWRVALLCLVTFHLHLACDFVGSRGPTAEDVWPIFYFGPFSKEPMWLWGGQWSLDSWQNKSFSVLLLLWSFWFANKRGRSVVEVFSARGDCVFVQVIRGWSGRWKRGLRPR
jgi:inner membrane protein